MSTLDGGLGGAKAVVTSFLNVAITVALMLIIIGSAMNLSVVYMNGGQMPVASEYEINKSDRHKTANDDTKLLFLIDRIHIQKYENPSKFVKWIARNMNYPLNPAVASVGDLFIWSAMIVIHILVAITLLVYIPLRLIEMHRTSTRQ